MDIVIYFFVWFIIMGLIFFITKNNRNVPEEIKSLYLTIDEVILDYSKQWFEINGVFKTIINPTLEKMIIKKTKSDLINIINDFNWPIKWFVYLQIVKICDWELLSWKYTTMGWLLNPLSDWPFLLDIYDDLLKKLIDLKMFTKKDVKIMREILLNNISSMR